MNMWHSLSNLRILCVLLFLPSLSYADWQYTKWGMTQEQVVKASKGVATPDPKRQQFPDGTESILTAPYISGLFIFTAHFTFDKKAHKLSGVTLLLEDAELCGILWEELKAKYGKPERQSEDLPGMKYSAWKDKTENNYISMTDNSARQDIKGICLLGYQPLFSSGL